MWRPTNTHRHFDPAESGREISLHPSMSWRGISRPAYHALFQRRWGGASKWRQIERHQRYAWPLKAFVCRRGRLINSYRHFERRQQGAALGAVHGAARNPLAPFNELAGDFSPRVSWFISETLKRGSKWRGCSSFAFAAIIPHTITYPISISNTNYRQVGLCEIF